GWPANHGVWIWGDEILVGFSKGYYKDLGAERHNIDRERTEWHLLARSLDGGESWSIEDPGRRDGDLVIPDIGRGSYHGVIRKDVSAQQLRDCSEGVDYAYPDFALKA